MPLCTTPCTLEFGYNQKGLDYFLFPSLFSRFFLFVCFFSQSSMKQQKEITGKPISLLIMLPAVWCAATHMRYVFACSFSLALLVTNQREELQRDSLNL